MTVQLELTCYRLANAVELAPARPTRAIFDRNKHAYRGSPQGLCAKARLEAQSMNIDYAAR